MEAASPHPVRVACVFLEVGAWGRLAAPGAEVSSPGGSRPACTELVSTVLPATGGPLGQGLWAGCSGTGRAAGARGPVQEPRPSSALLCANPMNVTSLFALFLGVRGPVWVQPPHPEPGRPGCGHVRPGLPVAPSPFAAGRQVGEEGLELGSVPRKPPNSLPWSRQRQSTGARKVPLTRTGPRRGLSPRAGGQSPILRVCLLLSLACGVRAALPRAPQGRELPGHLDAGQVGAAGAERLRAELRGFRHPHGGLLRPEHPRGWMARPPCGSVLEAAAWGRAPGFGGAIASSRLPGPAVGLRWEGGHLCRGHHDARTRATLGSHLPVLGLALGTAVMGLGPVSRAGDACPPPEADPHPRSTSRSWGHLSFPLSRGDL